MDNCKSYNCIALVSGKGGVGKTTLTTNLAWLVSNAPSRVLVVDLDFQNLGCTGLFASTYNLEKSNVLELFTKGNDLENHPITLTTINKNLYFLPAALIGETEEPLYISYDATDEIYDKLANLLERLHRQFSIECFVLDCHGGIDVTSFAAAGLCDYALIATEADTVTFSGTLGLVENYYEQFKHLQRKPNIEYIVNRIPSKYRWKELDRIYRKYLGKYLGRFTKSNSILAYIPIEGELSDSFGDYPFQVELAPKSIFTRKLELLLYTLFHASNPKLIRKNIAQRYQRTGYAKKINQSLISYEERNKQTIVRAYGAALFYFFFIYPIFYILLLLYSESSPETESRMLWIFGLLSLPFIVYFFISSIRNFLYCRENYKFQKALHKILPKEKTAWRWPKILKLRVLYYVAAAGSLFLALLLIFGLLLFIL